MVVLGALLGALSAIVFNRYAGWWLGVALPWLLLPAARLGVPRGALSASLLLLCAWLAAQVLWLNPAWQPKALYFVAALLTPLLIVSALPVVQLWRLARIATLLALLLALWGLAQHYLGWWVLIPMGGRANAIFYTPNSYASCLNLFLLPLTAWYLLAASRRSGGVGLAGILLLFAALLASASKGGLLAWLAGLLVLALLLGPSRLRSARHRLGRLGLGLAAVALASILLPSTVQVGGYEDRVQELLAQGDNVRLVLWDIAWKLVQEAPFIGHGYYNFHYFQLRDSYGALVGNQTRYAHNDYLQIWAETGSIGLLLFLAVPLATAVAVWRGRARLSPRAAALLIACGAGLATVYAHALVDFPFWPPALLLLSGALLGMVARLDAAARQAPPLFAAAHARLLAVNFRPAVAKGILGVAITLFAALPWASQEANRLGVQRAREGQAQAALFWTRLAQSLQPRDAYYYWREGLIWARVRSITGEAEHAARADALFARAMQANPFDVESVALRLILHRDHRAWLEQPAADAELLRWSGYLARWMPHHPRYRVEHINTLLATGRRGEAARERQAFAVLWPRLPLTETADGRVMLGRHVDPLVVPDSDLPQARQE
jgi:O-antigen ligase